MWLHSTIVAGVGLSALAWVGMSLYILAVQRQRDAMREMLARTLDALVPMAASPQSEQVATARTLLIGASREMVMHGAAMHDIPPHVFAALAAVIEERWTIARLVADAGAHVSGRDRWRRVTALQILARLEHPATIDLLARAVDDSDLEVASCALSLLGRSTDPRAIDLLLRALEKPRLSASRVAVYLDESPQDIGKRLVALLYHQQASMRQWGATLLARYPSPAIAARLGELTADADPRVRKAAIQTLGHHGAAGAAAYALQLLSDPVPFVRAHAVRTIGELGRTDLAARVCVLLGDADWWVRLAARESLEMMGTDVWPVVMRCLDHRDRFVRNGAAEVVQNLGILDSLIVLEAASDNPSRAKVDMLQRIAAAGGLRFTESLVERAGPVLGPRVRRLLDAIGFAHVGVA